MVSYDHLFRTLNRLSEAHTHVKSKVKQRTTRPGSERLAYTFSSSERWTKFNRFKAGGELGTSIVDLLVANANLLRFQLIMMIDWVPNTRTSKTDLDLNDERLDGHEGNVERKGISATRMSGGKV